MMSEPENKPLESGDLKSELNQLERRMNWLMILFIVVSITLMSFLAIEAKRTGTDLEGMRQRKTQLAEVSKNLQSFLYRLGEYGQTHPDFLPILTRYGIKVNSPVAPIPPSSSPATPSLMPPPGPRK